MGADGRGRIGDGERSGEGLDGTGERDDERLEEAADPTRARGARNGQSRVGDGEASESATVAEGGP